MCRVRKRSEVLNTTEEVRRLNYNRRSFVVDAVREFLSGLARFTIETYKLQIDTGMLHISSYNFQVLWMNRLGSDDFRSSRNPFGHQHCFGQSGRAVVHRCIGDFHSRQLADERLKFKDCLECALRNLWLVRCVGSEELGARKNMIDDRGNVV